MLNLSLFTLPVLTQTLSLLSGYFPRASPNSFLDPINGDILFALFYLLSNYFDHYIHSALSQGLRFECKRSSVASLVSDALQPLWTIALRLLCPWDYPGKNTGVGRHFLLKGIFLTQRSNLRLLCLLHGRWILYH